MGFLVAMAVLAFWGSYSEFSQGSKFFGWFWLGCGLISLASAFVT